MALGLFDAAAPPTTPTGAPAAAGMSTPTHPVVLPDTTMDELERMAITQALAKYNGNRTQAARALKIGTKTLYRKMEKYGITS